MFRRILFVLLALALSAPSAFAAEKEIKVGFLYVSPVGDSGWSYSHDLGREAMSKIPGVATYIAESVPEGAQSERAINKMARDGYDIIVTTSFGYMDPTIKVAGHFPKTTFLHCSGYKTSENVSAYFGRAYQPRYLTGMVAGRMTKSNQIGFVAAFPIPEVIRGINAFTLGVREVNPQAQVRVVWTKTWYDPAMEKEAARGLLDTGVDVITQHQDSAGPQEAAEERGAYCIGYSTDMSSFAPNGHLVAAVWNWTPFYLDVVDQVRKGTWKSGNFWPGMESGIVDLSPYGQAVPQSVRDEVERRKREIIDGKFVVFQGPIKDQTGNERVRPGVTLSDPELLSLDWFVEGVVGSPK